jgi:hypothetical protein
MERGARRRRRKHLFTKIIDPFIKEVLATEFDHYWKSSFVQLPHHVAKKDIGKLVLPIKTDTLDCELVAWTDFNSISIFVNNGSAKKGRRQKTIQWFKTHLSSSFLEMEYYDKDQTRHKIVVLDKRTISDNNSREEAMEKYKQIVLQVYRKVLPALEANG